MSNQHTPVHEGMRTCPACKRPNIFTVKDDERGTGGARCHYCNTLITISGAPLDVPAIVEYQAKIAELLGIPLDVITKEEA